jgi:hypothetical protein
MSKITNTSSVEMHVHVVPYLLPENPEAFSAVRIPPGETISFPPHPRGIRSACYLHDSAHRCFWSGPLGDEDELAVDPAAEAVRWQHVTLKQEHLDRIKELLREHPEFDSTITLEDLQAHARSREPNGESVMLRPVPGNQARSSSPCDDARAKIAIDAIAFAFSIVPLVRKMNIAIRGGRYAEILGSRLSAISEAVAGWETASYIARAGKVILVLDVIKDRLLQLIAELVHHMTLLDAFLFGTILLAEAAADIASEGIAVPFLIGAQIALNGLMIANDIKDQMSACQTDRVVDPDKFIGVFKYTEEVQVSNAGETNSPQESDIIPTQSSRKKIEIANFLRDTCFMANIYHMGENKFYWESPGGVYDLTFDAEKGTYSVKDWLSPAANQVSQRFLKKIQSIPDSEWDPRGNEQFDYLRQNSTDPRNQKYHADPSYQWTKGEFTLNSDNRLMRIQGPFGDWYERYLGGERDWGVNVRQP